MSKKALITGISGQDGAYLAKLLLEKGYDVYGACRRGANSQIKGLQYLKIEKDVRLISLDLLEFSNIFKSIKKIAPTEIYNLAAQSFVGISFEQPILTSQVNGIAILNILEIIKVLDPQIRFYQASTSEMFGKTQNQILDEDARFHPRSPYAYSKLFAHWAAINYREAYGLFTSCGILFNHESPLRGPEFVTRKITESVVKIASGLQEKLIIGNLNIQRDWGYAPEYVQAMWLMLQQKFPDDYIIATGVTHNLRDFIQIAFRCVDIELEWSGQGVDEKGLNTNNGKTLVEVSAEFFRPSEVDCISGDAGKAKKVLNWEATTSFEDLISIMVKSDFERITKT
jgi:GDPmannose 4,6-dehydratase